MRAASRLCLLAASCSAAFFLPGRGAVAADAAPAAPAAAAEATPQWQATWNSEARYFSWTSSRGYPNTISGRASGSQLYLPFGFEVSGKFNDDVKVETLWRSGYMSARQSGNNLGGGSFASVTDTSVSSTVTYLGLNGIQPFASLALNVPTGSTVLRGNAAMARGDTDVVGTPTFGEGFNFGPTVGANLPITPTLLATLSLGYTNRGAYDREGVINVITMVQGLTRLDPGDTTTVTASLAYRQGGLTVQASAFYSVESTTTLDGAAFYKSGDRIYVSGSATYVWSPAWSTNISATFAHYDKNKVTMLGVPDLVVEGFNSNSNVTTVDASLTYTIEQLAIGPAFGFMYRDHNGWDPNASQFLPQKTKVSAAMVAKATVTDALSFNARVERGRLLEDDKPDVFSVAFNGLIPGSGVPVTTSDYWQFVLGCTAKF